MERRLQTWTESGDQCDNGYYPVRAEGRVSVSERERSQSTGRELKRFNQTVISKFCVFGAT